MGDGLNIFNILFDVFPILFLLTFALVFGVVLFTLIRAAKQWKDNNSSPRLTVEATVVAKRTQLSGGSRTAHTTGHTSYYATFQVESGDRLELQVPHNRYGYLVEGDRGRLTFQGTRFLSFARQ